MDKVIVKKAEEGEKQEIKNQIINLLKNRESGIVDNIKISADTIDVYYQDHPELKPEILTDDDYAEIADYIIYSESQGTNWSEINASIKKKATKFNVTATNGEITRDEIIDTEENELFRDCITKGDIKKVYEDFWSIGNENIKVVSIENINSANLKKKAEEIKFKSLEDVIAEIESIAWEEGIRMLQDAKNRASFDDIRTFVEWANEIGNGQEIEQILSSHEVIDSFPSLQTTWDNYKSKQASLQKQAIGEQLQQIAEEVINKTHSAVQKAIDSGIEPDTAIQQITDNYLNEYYSGDDTFNDYSEDAMIEFMSIVENGVKEHLKEKKANLKKNAEDYQGWKNYETWAVALHIDNDQGWTDMVLEDIANMTDQSDISAYLKQMIEDGSPLDEPTLYTDLLNGAIEMVDWYELAEHYMTKIKETKEYSESKK